MNKEEGSIFYAIVTCLQEMFLSFLGMVSRGYQRVKIGIRKRTPWRLKRKNTSFTQLQKSIGRQENNPIAPAEPLPIAQNPQEEVTSDPRQALKAALISSAQSMQNPKALPELMEALKRLDTPQPFEDIEKTFNVSIVIQHLNEMTAVKIPLFLDGDLICEDSQGSYVEGHKARLSICLAAAQHFLDGNGFGSVDDIFTVMEEGIGLHLRHHVNKEHALADHIAGINEERLKQLKNALVAIIPHQIEEVDEGYLELMRETPFDIPFVGTVGDGFEPLLRMLANEAKDRWQKACGLIVCHDEPVLVFFPRPGIPYLFDAQGRSYNQESRGAALLKFDDVESLAFYLRKSLFKTRQSHFTMIMLGLKNLK